jgi:hypothetical protein
VPLDIDAMADAEIKGRLLAEVLGVMGKMKLFLNNYWPVVAQTYHTSRISLLHPHARL